MKRLLTTFLFGMIFQQLTIAQDVGPMWIAPPYYFDGVHGYLLPKPPGGYDGSPSKGSANLMGTYSSGIKFFVIDGQIYNSSGQKTATLTGFPNPYSAETAIVPDPANCNQYYIISIVDLYEGREGWTATPHIDLYNISSGTIVSRKTWFGNVPYDNFIAPAYVGIFPLTVPQTSVTSGLSGAGYGTLSVTRKQSDGSYFVTNITNTLLTTVKISRTGVSAQSSVLQIGGEEKEVRRGIQEIYEGQSENIIAYDQKSVNGQLVLLRMSKDMKTVIEQKLITVSTLDNSYIHGIEFSPSGRYLYITHENANGKQFEYYDFVTESLTEIETSLNVQFSEIESRKNASNETELFLLYEGGELKFNNVESPAQGQLSQVITFVNAPIPSYSVLDPTNQFNYLKYYLLPDQIDGEDYKTMLRGTIPAPAIVGASDFCSSASKTFTGSLSGLGTIKSYRWTITNPNNSVLYSGPSTLQATTPLGTFTIPSNVILLCQSYKVSLTVYNECNSNLIVTKPFNVNCPLAINAGIDINLCSNSLPATVSINVTSPTWPVLLNGVSYASSPIVIPAPTVTTDYTFYSNATVLPGNCPISSDVIRIIVIGNHPAFSTSVTPIAGTNYFTCLSTPLSMYNAEQQTIGFGQAYKVDDLNDAYPAASCSSASWFNTENFNGYNGLVSPAIVTCSNATSSPAGRFLNGHSYRITRTTSNSLCTAASWTAVITTNSGAQGTPGSPGSSGLPGAAGQSGSIESAEAINEKELLNTILITPNPTDGKFNINLQSKTAEKIVVYNLMGKVVFEVTDSENLNTIDIDLTDLSSGIYIVNIHSEGTIVARKIVKN
jgi:hypothetical protein